MTTTRRCMTTTHLDVGAADDREGRDASVAGQLAALDLDLLGQLARWGHHEREGTRVGGADLLWSPPPAATKPMHSMPPLRLRATAVTS